MEKSEKQRWAHLITKTAFDKINEKKGEESLKVVREVNVKRRRSVVGAIGGGVVGTRQKANDGQILQYITKMGMMAAVGRAQIEARGKGRGVRGKGRGLVRGRGGGGHGGGRGVVQGRGRGTGVRRGQQGVARGRAVEIIEI